MPDKVYGLSKPTGKYVLVVNQPTKASYGPFDSVIEASQWLTDRLSEHNFTQVYSEIVPLYSPVK